MLVQYQHYLPASLLSQGPLIRLCLRFILLFIFVIFFISTLYSTTENASVLWNPFREKKDQKLQQSRKESLCNLPPSEEENEILNEDPRFPRTRDWLYDHIYFSFYDGSRIYTNQEYIGGTVSRKTHSSEQLMLSEVQKRALTFLGNKYPGKYIREDCNSVRFRTIPTIGIEADVTCNDTKTGSVDKLSLLLPLKPPRITYHHSIQPTTTINIIMPLRGRVDNLKLFMTNLVRILQRTTISIGLTLVYFEDENVDIIQRILAHGEGETNQLKTQFILLNGKDFSRGYGLQVGVEQTTILGEVLFLCDVDVLFTLDFLFRCISTPVVGHQIFIPMVFSQYNPEFVYPLQKHKIPPPMEQHVVKDDHGYWRVWGHGMVCLYKADFHRIGGFDKERTGWGGEDLAFVRRTISAGDYKIIRSLEPGLFHRYHKKECDHSGKQYACIKMRAANEASKQSLGFWYFKQNEGISVYGALAEGNQLHYHDYEEVDPSARKTDTAQDDSNSQSATTLTQWLWERLCLLVLFAIIVLDMFLMIQNMKMKNRL